MTFDQAKEWYQQRATNMERAGVKIRLFHAYPTVENEMDAFVLAVQDERAGTPLPGPRGKVVTS